MSEEFEREPDYSPVGTGPVLHRILQLVTFALDICG